MLIKVFDFLVSVQKASALLAEIFKEHYLFLPS